MSVEENKALVRRFYAEIDAGNIDAMDELVAEDYLDHSPPPFPGLGSGREGLKQAFRIFWEATPGRHEIEDQVAEGDKVVTRITAVGRHRRRSPRDPEDGKRAEGDCDSHAPDRQRKAGREVVGQGPARLPSAAGGDSGPTRRRALTGRGG